MSHPQFAALHGAAEKTKQEKEDQPITHFHIADNSDGLRSWLKEKGVEFIPNGHFTSIPLEGNDIFSLGIEFGLYREKNKGGIK